MEPVTLTKPLSGSSRTQCPDRVEVDAAETEVSAAVVKAWVAHLRSHGWTDKDLDLQWLTRARHGVTR